MDKHEAFVGARIPSRFKELIAEFLKRDTHLNESDFVRDALREKIRRDAPELYAELFIQKEGTVQ
jgi:Arc/MetJ-type ribon-helix-helix transcriptional regulator